MDLSLLFSAAVLYIEVTVLQYANFDFFNNLYQNSTSSIYFNLSSNIPFEIAKLFFTANDEELNKL